MPYKFNPISGQLDLVNTPGTAYVTGQAWKVNTVIAPDGAVATFTVPDTYAAGSLKVYVNGLRQIPGSGYDFVEASGTTFTFTSVPAVTDKIVIDYIIAITTSDKYDIAKYDTTGVYA